MRKFLLASSLYLAAAAGVALAGEKAAEPKGPVIPPFSKTATGKLIVHEWGTFTYFAGSDGVYLDYRPLVDSDLPKFVFDREKETALTQKRLASAAASFSKVNILSRSRMETPVTYFYTDAPMQVMATVDFPKGLLTEFYPPPRVMGPMVGKDEKQPKIGGAFLDWGLFTIWPQGMIASDKSRIPAVTEGNHYAAARETDSDIVQITDPAFGNIYEEKFLFYRGIGNFELPVQMKAIGKDQFTLTNGGGTPLRAAFLVNIDHGKVRFSRYADVAATTSLALPTELSSLDALASALTADLVGDGLYEKEAKAMVQTWNSSWFGEDGTRLLYLVPQAQTDALLPLKILPKPQQKVRVMVGRLETMTPEKEGSIGKLILGLGADDFKARESAMRQIKQMGRFAEPALQRVSQTSDDPEIKSRAQVLLGDIRAGR